MGTEKLIENTVVCAKQFVHQASALLHQEAFFDDVVPVDDNFLGWELAFEKEMT